MQFFPVFGVQHKCISWKIFWCACHMSSSFSGKLTFPLDRWTNQCYKLSAIANSDHYCKFFLPTINPYFFHCISSWKHSPSIYACPDVSLVVKITWSKVIWKPENIFTNWKMNGTSEKWPCWLPTFFTGWMACQEVKNYFFVVIVGHLFAYFSYQALRFQQSPWTLFLEGFHHVHPIMG